MEVNLAAGYRTLKNFTRRSSCAIIIIGGWVSGGNSTVVRWMISDCSNSFEYHYLSGWLLTGVWLLLLQLDYPPQPPQKIHYSVYHLTPFIQVNYSYNFMMMCSSCIEICTLSLVWYFQLGKDLHISKSCCTLLAKSLFIYIFFIYWP